MNTLKKDEIMNELNESAMRINDDSDFLKIIDSLLNDSEESNSNKKEDEKNNIAALPQSIQ
jgi:hypothetical protein